MIISNQPLNAYTTTGEDYNITTGPIFQQPIYSTGGWTSMDPIINFEFISDVHHAAIGKDEESMHELYEVIVIDRYDGTILMDKKVVASGEEEAKYEVGVYTLIEHSGVAFDEVCVACRRIAKVDLIDDEDCC